MSYGRFAAITSDLLARKGEARPWSMSPPASRIEPRAEAPRLPVVEIPPPPPHPIAQPIVPPPIATGGSEPPETPAFRRCTIRVSAHDYERLGIIAVKDDTSRAHLLQEALARFLRAKEKQYRAGCQCMAAQPCGSCES